VPMVVANRYARALAEVVAKTGEYSRTLRDLENVLALYRESAELREVCESPAVALAAKVKLMATLGERLGAAPVTLNFLRVLLAHYRMPLLGEIAEAFRKITHDRLGITEVKITSSTELTTPEREALRARFAALTGKRAELEFQLDPHLLGGVVAQIGSTVYDGSIRGELERIREHLLAR